MTTMTAEPTIQAQSTHTGEPTTKPKAAPRDLCPHCRCPNLASGDSGVTTPDFAPQEALASLLPALARHPELDQITLAYHARQCDETADQGHHHTAINEARAFFEALIVSIGLEQERPPAESIADFRKRRNSHYGFHSCNNYLAEIGFLGPHERITVLHVYTMADDSGSHAGVSSEQWCRFARRIVWTAAQYIIQRYAAWQSGCRCHAA